MIFRLAVLEGIRDGRITVAFRRWTRPTVRTGGTLRTAIGIIAIQRVSQVALDDIIEADARAAGFQSRQELVGDLTERPEGLFYRIDLAPAGPDPRVVLREQSSLTTEEIDGLKARLEAIDRRSRSGPWTFEVLRLIEEKPATHAARLAAVLGRETLPFKRDVRKLKELGLTESLEVGYRLSPRGRSFLEATARHEDTKGTKKGAGAVG